MGIENPDYMKRPPDDGGRPGSTPNAKLEAFLERHPRFFTWLTVGLVVLFVVVLVVVNWSGRRP